MCASVKFHERESAKDLLKRKRKNMLVTVFVITAYVVFVFTCVKNMLAIVKIENVKKLVSVFHIFENDIFD